MNIVNMRRTRARIASAGPDHCNMNYFIYSAAGHGVVRGVGRIDCGTTACVAGFAIAVDKRVLNEDDLVEINEDVLAAEILGLKRSVPRDMCLLFYKDEWPEYFQDMARADGDQPAMLALLDAMIEGTVVLDGEVWLDQYGNPIDPTDDEDDDD